jgi:hypothetical protein
LNADRLEDRLRDTKWQAVEWPYQNNAVLALAFSIQALAYGGSDLTENLGRDMF